MEPKKKKATQKVSSTAPKTPVWKITPEQQIVGAVFLGKVQDYLSHLGVVTMVLESPLTLGDTIRIKGHTTDLTQKVEHMEINREAIQSASTGEGVGIKVADKVRTGDAVYKL
jgi:putative protease